MHYPEGSPLCNFICRNLQRGLHSRPLPLFTGLPRGRGRPGQGAWHRQHVCGERSTRSPAQRSAHPGQELTLGRTQLSAAALSSLPQSLLTQPSAGWSEEAHFHVRTPSALPARHGPCSKAGKTLQSPRRALRAHLHRAGASGWVGSGRDPHPNLSCCSACGCWWTGESQWGFGCGEREYRHLYFAPHVQLCTQKAPE